MDGKVVAAVGGCAVLAGVAYILRGDNKTKQTRLGQPDLFPGLVNRGNTCYLNSVLQALASVSSFVSWLNNLQQMDGSKKLTSELSKLMLVLNNPCYEEESYDPVSIFKSLCSHGWVIAKEQQDAHEMFQAITSTLADEEEFTSPRNWNSVLKNKVNEIISDDSIVHRSRVTASKIERKSLSPFSGLFANQLSCKMCLKKYPAKFDYFDSISLSLPQPFQFGSYTLQNLLRNFLCSEIVESFECTNCDGENGMRKNQKRLLKKLSLGKLPHCLCFHINRTYWQNNGTPYKNNTFISFSEKLDIEPFLYNSSDINSKIEIPAHFQVMSPASKLDLRNPIVKDEEQDDVKKDSSHISLRLALNTQYHLVAVIVHLGGVHEGHFVTYRKLDTRSDKWSLVSDERVQTVPFSHVLKSNAYMLFYERTTK